MTYRLLFKGYFEDFDTMTKLKAIVKELGLKNSEYHTTTRRVR